MRDNREQVGRIAFREEGPNWVAYYALTDTMEGAFFLGAIPMGAVVGNANRKDEFMDLMRGIVSDGFIKSVGQAPTWKDPTPAPESEQSGNA